MGARAADKQIKGLKTSGTQRENKRRLLPLSSNISRLKYERNTDLFLCPENKNLILNELTFKSHRKLISDQQQ